MGPIWSPVALPIWVPYGCPHGTHMGHIEIASWEVLSFCQIYISRKIGVPEFYKNVFIARKVNMT